MRGLRFILSVVIALGLAVVGLVLIAEGWGIRYRWLEIWQATPSWQRMALGFLLVVLVLARALLAIWPREGAAYLVLDQPLGQVAISLDGISDFLAKSAAVYPWLESVRPEVSIGDNALNVDLKCRIRTAMAVPNLCARLQEHVREKLKTYLGDVEVGRIRVTVRQIAVSPEPPVGSMASGRPAVDLEAEPTAKTWS